jgi:hypothetical protein
VGRRARRGRDHDRCGKRDRVSRRQLPNVGGPVGARGPSDARDR